MAKISSNDAVIHAVNMLVQSETPPAPAAGRWKYFFKADGLHLLDDQGVVTGPVGAAGAGDVASDALWVAKGDLVVGAGAGQAARLPVGADGQLLVAAGGEAAGVQWAPLTRYLTFGLNGPLAVGAGAVRLYLPFAGRLLRVQAAVGAAPAGASIVVDLNKNGATVFADPANRPAIPAGAFASAWATPAVTTVAAGDYLTLDVDQVGSGSAGAELVVMVEAVSP